MNRPTFSEACDAVLEKSSIKSWLDGNRSDRWHVAFEADLAAAHDVFTKLTADLSAITRRKVEVKRKFDMSQMMVQKFPSIEKRMEAAYELLKQEFTASLGTFVNKVINCRAWVEEEYQAWQATYHTFPLAAISLPTDGDTMQFDFTDEFKCRAMRYTLIDPQLIPVADFNRSLPERVKHKLGILEKTHFDYSPVILDGYLIDAIEVDDQKPVGPRGPDPGLVIDVAGQRLLVDYWYEPTRSFPASRLVYGIQRKLFRSSVIWSLLLSSMIGALSGAIYAGEGLICKILWASCFALSCGSAYAGLNLPDDVFRTKADIYKPCNKLLM